MEPLFPISASEATQQDVAVGRDIPVTFGRRGPLRAADGWLDSGPAVPLLGLATLAMLLAGGLMIARRCGDESPALAPVEGD